MNNFKVLTPAVLETQAATERAAGDVNQGKLLPALILAYYFFMSWKPPIDWLPKLNWYVLLGVALFAYVIQRKPLDFARARFYWIPEGLIFLGSILALLRSPTFDESLFNLTSFIITLLTFLLFIPTFATITGRKWALYALLAAGVVWIIYVHNTRALLVTLLSSTFTGKYDKNIISLSMAMFATALFAFSVLWLGNVKLRTWQLWFVRLMAFSGGVFALYSVSLTYSRSQLIAGLVSLVAVIAVLVFRLKGLRGVLAGLGILLASGIIIQALIPNVLSIATDWEYEIDPILNLESPTSFVSRRELIDKGAAIIWDNPLIGIGIGNTISVYRNDFEYYSRGLIHSTYLSTWAETGILGFMGVLLWLYWYLKLLRWKLFSLTLIDQIWLVSLVPFMLGILFLDVQFIPYVALIAGIYYQPALASEIKRLER